MTKVEIQKMVEEGFRLDQEIKELNPKVKRLEAIKEVLKGLADGREIDLPAKGCVAAITQPAMPVRKVAEEDVPRVKELAGRFFGKLFGYAPVGKFADVAGALLGDQAEELVKVVCPKSARVSFREA